VPFWHGLCSLVFEQDWLVLWRQIIRRDAFNINFWEKIMINWAVTFLIIAIIAALFGFTGIAGTATNIAWILFIVGLVVAAIFYMRGRRGV
jgi:uncharacterized membrane protein YtjA (UPF0391 family)